MSYSSERRLCPARRQGSHTEKDCSVLSHKYRRIISSCALAICTKSNPSARASRRTGRQQHWASLQLSYSIRIWYALKAHAIAQLSNPQNPCSEDVQRSSHTHATLSSDRKPIIVHLTFPTNVTSKPVSQYQHRYGRDCRSRCLTSRVNHLRPHERLASTCNRLEWMSIDERRTRNTRLAPAISGHAEQPRNQAG